MMHDSQLPVSFLDLIVIGILFHAQNFVVVLSFALLELELCVPNVLVDAWLCWVAFLDVLELPNSFFPVA